MATDITEKKLFRASDGAYIGGVCAGLADFYDVDTIIVRILAILLSALTLGVAVFVYLVLWARIPLEPEHGFPYEVLPESAESSAFGYVDVTPYDSEERRSRISVLTRLAVAAGLMLLFLAVSMNVSPLLPGTSWWQFWPLGLLMGGLCLIVIPIRTRNEAAWHAAGIVITSVSASILPMSLGIMSWSTVGNAFSLLWPLIVAAVLLCIAGLRLNRRAYVIGSAFCVVAFCVLGLVLCGVPGELETFFLYTPTGRMFRIDLMR